jgi:hypothetical protein
VETNQKHRIDEGANTHPTRFCSVGYLFCGVVIALFVNLVTRLV